MKKKKIVPESAEKKLAKKSRMAVKSQLKAGEFWGDLKDLYAPLTDQLNLPT